MRVLFANIGWMIHYRGYNPKDQIDGGGSYRNDDKHEVYNFIGKTKTKTGQTYISEISETETTNVTVYAQWEKIIYYGNITYELNGGTLPEGAAVKYEEGKEIAYKVIVDTNEEKLEYIFKCKLGRKEF